VFDNENDMFDLLRSAELEFNKEVLIVTFTFSGKKKTLTIPFKENVIPRGWETVVEELRASYETAAKENYDMKVELIKTKQ
jgi:hypothetical protein